MKTWYVENIDNISLHEEVLHRKENEVKVKISKVALSSSDIVYFANEQTKSKIPGHSAIGYVSEADDESGLKLGSRVVISPFVSVMENGIKTVKTIGFDVDGLLADFVSVPAENVYQLPDGVKDDDAVFTEYIAFGINIFESIKCEKGDYVVIVGASTLGFILSQIAVYYQMVPILIDLDADKLKLAEDNGIFYTLNPTYDNLERKVEEITGGRMAEIAAYVGDGVSCDAALRLVKNRGITVIAGYGTLAKHTVDLDTVLKKQITVKGIGNGYGEMSSAINLLANQIIKTDGLISRRISFDEVPESVVECAKYPYQFNKILVNLE